MKNCTDSLLDGICRLVSSGEVLTFCSSGLLGTLINFPYKTNQKNEQEFFSIRSGQNKLNLICLQACVITNAAFSKISDAWGSSKGLEKK